ncbi:hypothetical protein ACVDG5_032015 [Mesorhizobium sp. ORM6]
MERRLFLTGMLGVAGAVAFASVAGPGRAIAGIPQGNGILDELDKPDPAVFEEMTRSNWSRSLIIVGIAAVIMVTIAAMAEAASRLEKGLP